MPPRPIPPLVPPSLAMVGLALALLTLAFAPSVRAEAERPPAPRFDRVDHRRPRAHLAISPRVGDAKKLHSLAAQLRGPTPAETLASIHRWMARNLRFDKSKDRSWRSFDRMLTDRSYGGCADHAAVFGTLARAAGIPTIWVKTMDVAWIEDFRHARPGWKDYRGHVFLEVYVSGRWQLLDAQAMRLWPRYDVNARILPGNRFAYDKGDDPFDLVLSCRWELWRAQTDAYFAALDLGLLPYGDALDLLAPWEVYVAGDNPLYRYAADTCRRLGYVVPLTFNQDWARVLPVVRGKTLVVTCRNGREPVFPATLWDAWLPPGARRIATGGAAPASGWLDRRFPDGTRVILVTATSSTAMQVSLAAALRAGTASKAGSR